MTHVILAEESIESVEPVLEWFGLQGHPQTKTMRDHLMAWQGDRWIIRKKFNMGVIGQEWHIEINDVDLLIRFLERWA